MNQIFDVRRFGWLARKDFYRNWRSMIITAGAISGAFFVLTIIGTFFDGERVTDYTMFFHGTLIVWGIIAASLAFNELHDKTRNEDFLLLPASSLEKTLVRLVYVLVVLPLFIMILVAATSILTEGATALFFRLSFRPFNPFADIWWNKIGDFIFIQSVFFLGASWFKKTHLVKTVLTMMVFSTVLGFFGVFVFLILFARYFIGFFESAGMGINFEILLQQQFPALLDTLVIIGKVVFHAVLAPFCWFVAWLRVKETQSSHGI